MTTATKTRKPAAPKTVAPTGDETAALIATLRDRWNVADDNETRTQDLFKAAGIAWENARVIKVRVAYAAAMVKPNGKEANLLNACRILYTNETDSAAVRTKEATAKKSTLRNYVDAGVALQEAGLANSMAEPDANERKIVAAVFREGNKRDKAESKGNAGDDTLDGGNTPLKDDEQDESVTFTHLVAHVAGMNAVLKMLKAGSVPVSEREASNMADMLNEFQLQLSAYAEGV